MARDVRDQWDIAMSGDRAARQARMLRLELTTLVVAAVVPILLWHDNVLATLSAFRWELAWFTGLFPVALMVIGVLCYVPVVRYRARPADPRFYEPEPHAWQAWAVVLYTLGFCLSTQTAQLAHGIQS
jgi:hypothetical protein